MLPASRLPAQRRWPCTQLRSSKVVFPFCSVNDGSRLLVSHGDAGVLVPLSAALAAENIPHTAGALGQCIRPVICTLQAGCAAQLWFMWRMCSAHRCRTVVVSAAALMPCMSACPRWPALTPAACHVALLCLQSRPHCTTQRAWRLQLRQLALTTFATLFSLPAWWAAGRGLGLPLGPGTCISADVVLLAYVSTNCAPDLCSPLLLPASSCRVSAAGRRAEPTACLAGPTLRLGMASSPWTFSSRGAAGAAASTQ